MAIESSSRRPDKVDTSFRGLVDAACAYMQGQDSETRGRSLREAIVFARDVDRAPVEAQQEAYVSHRPELGAVPGLERVVSDVLGIAGLQNQKKQ